MEALGRPADFDQKRDSIVRVEAHRLRKRLREYYEADGRRPRHPHRDSTGPVRAAVSAAGTPLPSLSAETLVALSVISPEPVSAPAPGVISVRQAALVAGNTTSDALASRPSAVANGQRDTKRVAFALLALASGAGAVALWHPSGRNGG